MRKFSLWSISCFAAVIFYGCVNGRLDWASTGNSPPGVGADPASTPQLGSVTPTRGAHGTTLTIRGDSFAVGATVTIGGVTCTNVHLVSETELTCALGKHAGGLVGVAIANPASSSTSLSDAFTYLNFLYVSSETEIAVKAYAIEETTGELSEIAGSPFLSNDVGNKIIVSPNGKFLYTFSTTSFSVQRFAINSETGSIALLTAEEAGNSPRDLVFRSDGRYAFVENGSLGKTFAVDSQGRFTEIPGSPFSGFETSVGYALSYDDNFLFATAADGNLEISSFAIGSASGTLTFHDNGFLPSGDAIGICAHPSLKAVYGVGDNTVGHFRYTETGEIDGVASYTVGAAPLGCYIEPNGKFLFVPNNNDDNLSRFAIADSGALTALGETGAASNPATVAFSHSGNFLYVLLRSTDSVRGYRIDSSSGGLTALASVGAGVNPIGLAVN